MIIGPKFKIARRLGSRIFPKTQTTKFSISGSATRGGGGRRGSNRRPKPLSEYGAQLIEKQKARYTYGLKESQFANYVKRARHVGGHSLSPATSLYQGLETRLDNVVFRLGLAVSRAFARQLVTHGHITLNGRRLNIPSATVRVGDRVATRVESRRLGPFKDLAPRLKNYQTPEWLSFDLEQQSGEMKGLPGVGAIDPSLNFGAVLEFYGRV